MGIILPDKVYLFLFRFSSKITKQRNEGLGVIIELKIIHCNLNFDSTQLLCIVIYNKNSSYFCCDISNICFVKF